MKVSDITTYVMKVMGFGFKKIRSSSFRDIQKSAKSQDLEYSCTQTGVNNNNNNFISVSSRCSTRVLIGETVNRINQIK